MVRSIVGNGVGADVLCVGSKEGAMEGIAVGTAVDAAETDGDALGDTVGAEEVEEVVEAVGAVGSGEGHAVGSAVGGTEGAADGERDGTCGAVGDREAVKLLHVLSVLDVDWQSKAGSLSLVMGQRWRKPSEQNIVPARKHHNLL